MKSSLKFITAAFMAFSVIAVAGCAPSSTQVSTGQYVDDTVLTTKVKAAIFNDPALKVAEINVETYNGVVQLSGFVSSNAAAERAVYVANQVEGVKSVRNDMRLKQLN